MMCIVSYSSVEYFNYLINGTEFMYCALINVLARLR